LHPVRGDKYRLDGNTSVLGQREVGKVVAVVGLVAERIVEDYARKKAVEES
jgi:hypothetical protein